MCVQCVRDNHIHHTLIIAVLFIDVTRTMARVYHRRHRARCVGAWLYISRPRARDAARDLHPIAPDAAENTGRLHCIMECV